MVLNESQLNRSVDAASHSIFEAEVSNRQHGMIKGRNALGKNHCDKDDVETNCNAKECVSAHGKTRDKCESQVIKLPALQGGSVDSAGATSHETGETWLRNSARIAGPSRG